jgi:hypothetical protein
MSVRHSILAVEDDSNERIRSLFLQNGACDGFARVKTEICCKGGCVPRGILEKLLAYTTVRPVSLP